MAEKQTNKDRMREIVDSIENGIKELFESDKYRKYLATMSRFHRYSVNNTMLIYMQRPDATHVAGFNKWRNQFGRNVLKGEKGIRIIAPTPYKKKVEEIKTDPETNAPVLDADGKAIIEEKEIRIPMFKTFARKADVESTISNVTQYYEQETNPKRKKMLNAYIGLLRKTALSVGITRRFFVVIEFQKTISNDGSRFELVVADLNAMAANVRSHMEQCGNVFIPALGNPDRNEDAGIHQLFYQLLNRRKSETVSFHDHMQQPESTDDVFRRCRPYADQWTPSADRIWADEHPDCASCASCSACASK